MLGNNFSLLFYLKKPKNYKQGAMPIYLRITVDGIVKEICTSRQCDPKLWSKKGEKATGRTEECRELNHYLSTLRMKVFEVKRLLIEAHKAITADAIRNYLKGRGEDSKKILEIFEQHNLQMKALIGQEFSAATAKRYRTALGHARSFIKWKYGAEDVEIKRLDFEFLSDYEFWFKSVRKCNHNTAMKYISNFRKIVNRCIQNGWLHRDPFSGFKMTTREVERVALTEHELQVLCDKEFTIARLEQVRDVFLFCCFTGLSYADARKLKRSEIVIGIDGGDWIFTNRQKTDTASRIPLLPTSSEILEKYKDHPQCNAKGVVLPVLSNQKMNSYLKEIADVCAINKSFTFHIARHTFATTVTLSNGVPIETVSKMLGHKNLRTTQHYAKILDKKVSDDMAILRHKLQKIG